MVLANQPSDSILSSSKGLYGDRLENRDFENVDRAKKLEAERFSGKTPG